jgi:hypothetical protein
VISESGTMHIDYSLMVSGSCESLISSSLPREIEETHTGESCREDIVEQLLLAFGTAHSNRFGN